MFEPLVIRGCFELHGVTRAVRVAFVGVGDLLRSCVVVGLPATAGVSFRKKGFVGGVLLCSRG